MSESFKAFSYEHFVFSHQHSILLISEWILSISTKIKEH